MLSCHGKIDPGRPPKKKKFFFANLLFWVVVGKKKGKKITNSHREKFFHSPGATRLMLGTPTPEIVVHRYAVQTKYPDIHAACLPVFDRHLATIYTGLRKDGVKATTFLSLYGNVVKLIVDNGDLALIEKHSADLSLCREAVCRVTNTSLLGSALLSEKLAHLESRDYSVTVDKVIDAFSKLPKVSGDDLKKTLQQCADEAQNVGVRGRELRDRVIKVAFLDGTLEMKASDLHHEAMLKAMASMKTRAWGCKDGIEPLVYESWILPAKSGAVSPIQSELLSEAREARQLCRDLLDNPDIGTFTHMQSILNKKHDVLCSLDVSFELELAWLANAGAQLEASLLAKALATLPTSTCKRSMSEVTHALEELKKGMMYKRAPAGIQEQISTVIQVIHDMSRGVSPATMDGQSSDFFAKMLEGVSHFFIEKVEDTEVSGKPAVVQYTKFLKGKFDKSQDITMSELERLRPFWYLLTSAEVAIMTSITEYAVAKVSGKRLIEKPAERQTEKDKKRKTSAAGESSSGDAAKAAVMKMFQ